MTEKRSLAGTHVVDDLETLRALANPLRLRILEQLAIDEHTTKQVAELLGEKPTRLYHHVRALEDAGLVRLVRTSPKRGTTEKYYRAVASLFRVAPGLFTVSDPDVAVPGLTEAEAILRRTADELRELAPAAGASPSARPALFTQLRVLADPAKAERLERRLEALLDELAGDLDDADREGVGAEPEGSYRLVIAYFPLPAEEPERDR